MYVCVFACVLVHVYVLFVRDGWMVRRIAFVVDMHHRGRKKDMQYPINYQLLILPISQILLHYL